MKFLSCKIRDYHQNEESCEDPSEGEHQPDGQPQSELGKVRGSRPSRSLRFVRGRILIVEDDVVELLEEFDEDDAEDGHE